MHVYDTNTTWELLLGSADGPADDAVHRVSEVLQWESTVLECPMMTHYVTIPIYTGTCK